MSLLASLELFTIVNSNMYDLDTNDYYWFTHTHTHTHAHTHAHNTHTHNTRTRTQHTHTHNTHTHNTHTHTHKPCHLVKLLGVSYSIFFLQTLFNNQRKHDHCVSLLPNSNMIVCYPRSDSTDKVVHYYHLLKT